jgi:hypothetical protein
VTQGSGNPSVYLYDIGFTRDVWMHRIDLYRAVNQPYPADASHDGRLLADITPNGPAPTTTPSPPPNRTGWRHLHPRTNTPGETLQIDAINCCRILSGHGTPVGVLVCGPRNVKVRLALLCRRRGIRCAPARRARCAWASGAPPRFPTRACAEVARGLATFSAELTLFGPCHGQRCRNRGGCVPEVIPMAVSPSGATPIG